MPRLNRSTRRALRIRERDAGPEKLVVTDPLLGLANISREQGKYAKAEPLYRRTLYVCEQQVGETHLVTAQVLYDFAGFHQVQGQYPEAAVLYQRALAARETILGAHHQLTIDTRERLQEVARLEAAHTQERIAPAKNQTSEA